MKCGCGCRKLVFKHHESQVDNRIYMYIYATKSFHFNRPEYWAKSFYLEFDFSKKCIEGNHWIGSIQPNFNSRKPSFFRICYSMIRHLSKGLSFEPNIFPKAVLFRLFQTKFVPKWGRRSGFCLQARGIGDVQKKCALFYWKYTRIEFYEISCVSI